MVDTMNREEPVSHDPISGEEDPTRVAELFIRLVPRDAGNRRFERPAGLGPRFSKDRINIPDVRARLYAAIEAETATVREVGAETIARELSQIMSPRPAVNDPADRRLGRRASWNRRLSLVEALRGPGVGASWRTSPDAQEPTAAAELHITLVHS